MGDTAISWTDKTWNPVVGCSIVSPGCTNCYAMKMAGRIAHMDSLSHYHGTTKIVKRNTVWTGKLVQAPEHILMAPLKWKKPCRIFVNSMGDLFHEDVPDEWIDKVFAVMALCPQHTFQVLTKRSKRMLEWATEMMRPTRIVQAAPSISQVGKGLMVCNTDWPLPNVWLGVSAEDQARADERIPDLLATPAAVRFVSAEPLLGPIDFTNFTPAHSMSWAASTYTGNDDVERDDLFGRPVNGPNWIIAGGESGPDFRPMQIEWAQAIRQQCAEAGTAFFFKQDASFRSGQRGRASDALWACKKFPAPANPTPAKDR